MCTADPQVVELALELVEVMLRHRDAYVHDVEALGRCAFLSIAAVMSPLDTVEARQTSATAFRASAVAQLRADMHRLNVYELRAMVETIRISALPSACREAKQLCALDTQGVDFDDQAQARVVIEACCAYYGYEFAYADEVLLIRTARALGIHLTVHDGGVGSVYGDDGRPHYQIAFLARKRHYVPIHIGERCGLVWLPVAVAHSVVWLVAWGHVRVQGRRLRFGCGRSAITHSLTMMTARSHGCFSQARRQSLCFVRRRQPQRRYVSSSCKSHRRSATQRKCQACWIVLSM